MFLPGSGIGNLPSSSLEQNLYLNSSELKFFSFIYSDSSTVDLSTTQNIHASCSALVPINFSVQ